MLQSAFASDPLRSPAAAAADAAAAAVAQAPELLRGAEIARPFATLGAANYGARCALAETQHAIPCKAVGTYVCSVCISCNTAPKQRCKLLAAISVMLAQTEPCKLSLEQAVFAILQR